jgi:predicted transcriptional regulator
MQTPQEITVWYILPALRRELTIALKNKKIKQTKIASILGITEAAVSQYLKHKRAKAIKFDENIIIEIKKAADNMLNDEHCHRYEIQNLINIIKKTGFLCKIHRKYDDVPKCCNVCITQNLEEIKCRSI